jgi:hypothetical protein
MPKNTSEPRESQELSASCRKKGATVIAFPAPSNPSVIDEHGAAALLGIAPATLRNLRSQGRGPRYYRVGRRIIYRPRDVERYLDAHAVDPESPR